jgi:polysaccharide export outer membrane protein
MRIPHLTSKPIFPFVALVCLHLVCGRPALSQSPAPAVEPVLSSSAAEDYTAGPQDVLDVTVFGESDVSGKFLVEADGTFNFPLIGRVKAGGRTLRAIERELHSRLADGYLQNPQVSVAVGQFRSQRVFIVGEVGRPGTYPLSAQMTLIEALATAGSPGTAAAGHVVIIRASRSADGGRAGNPAEVLQVDLGKFQAGSLTDNVVLRDGDVVVVPRAESIYVLGQVRSPGAYTIEKQMTVLQALALAGGVTDRASMSRIRIVRVVNGKKTELKANVDDAVRPGDTVMVLERFF